MNECSICLNLLNNNIEIHNLKCNHSFHIFCVYDWIKKKKSCPLCRKSITTYNYNIIQQKCIHYLHNIFMSNDIETLKRIICNDLNLNITFKDSKTILHLLCHYNNIIQNLYCFLMIPNV